MLELDLIQTLAFAGVALLLGEGLRRVVPVLARYNLPAPVLGGLLVAVAVLIARGQGVTLVQFDTTLQSPLMIAFFTTIGFGASLSLLKVGGPQVLRFFLLATVFAVLQNVVGMVMAVGFGLHPLFGVLAGSVTLTGGPATGLAFAPLFEEAGVIGASSVAIAVAIGGIVAGGLVGGPVGTVLIERGKIPTPRRGQRGAGGTADVALVETEVETTVLASTGRRRRLADRQEPRRDPGRDVDRILGEPGLRGARHDAAVLHRRHAGRRRDPEPRRRDRLVRPVAPLHRQLRHRHR